MSKIFIQILIDLLLLVCQQKSAVFFYRNLSEFVLVESGYGTTPEDLAYFVRHMPVLQRLFVYINLTQHESFARYSYFEDMLPQSIITFQFSACLNTTMSNDIETGVDDKFVPRFPMKIYNSIIYTVPWRWFRLLESIPTTDYHQSCITRTKVLRFLSSQCENQTSVDALMPWKHATTIESIFKLPSLNLFRHLRILKTSDAEVVHSILPPTLRYLELTGRLF